MANRWAIAKDPRLLARIAEQEARRSMAAPAGPKTNEQTIQLGGEDSPPKKKPSAATLRAGRVALNNQDSRRDSLHYDEASNTLSILLPGAELLNQNMALRMHNAKQSMLKTTWIKRIEALMILNMQVYDLWKVNQQRAFPLILEEVYATGEGTCLDVESVVAACKPVVDALVRVKFIPDDSREYIAQPIAYTFRQPNNGLVLVLRPSPRPWGMVSDSSMALAQSLQRLPDA